MERIHEQIVDITGLVNPQFTSTVVEVFAPQVVVLLPPFEEFTAPRVQPSPSGTDCCREDDAEHNWKFSCTRNRRSFEKFLWLLSGYRNKLSRPSMWLHRVHRLPSGSSSTSTSSDRRLVEFRAHARFMHWAAHSCDGSDRRHREGDWKGCDAHQADAGDSIAGASIAGASNGTASNGWAWSYVCENAVDEHGTPRCPGSWKKQCIWLRVRGLLYDTLDVKRVAARISTQCIEIADHIRARHVRGEPVLSLSASGRTTGIMRDSGDVYCKQCPFSKVTLCLKPSFIGILADCVLPVYLMRISSGADTLSLPQQKGRSFVVSKRHFASFTFDPTQTSNRLQKVPTRSQRNVLLDGNIISVGAECFRCKSVFQPSIIGKEAYRIQDTSFQNVMKCDVDIRVNLYANVVLPSSTTMFQEISERMNKETDGIVPTHDEIKVVAPPERQYSVRIGGSILFLFQQMWILRASTMDLARPSCWRPASRINSVVWSLIQFFSVTKFPRGEFESLSSSTITAFSYFFFLYCADTLFNWAQKNPYSTEIHWRLQSYTYKLGMFVHESRIDDYWNIDGSRNLYDSWTVFAQFTR